MDYITILTSKVISYWALGLFAYATMPYIIKAFNKKLGTNYIVFIRSHKLIGWVAIILATVHSLAWLIKLNFTWFGIISFVFAIVGAITGYQFAKHRKVRMYLNVHIVCFFVSTVLLIIHFIKGI